MTAADPSDVSMLGDWCDRCADRGDEDPVRFPFAVDEEGTAAYRCQWCGHFWTCWWNRHLFALPRWPRPGR
jgi:hypothetical protein